MLYELLGLVVRALHAGSALLLPGTLLCLHLAPRDEPSLIGWRARWLHIALLLAIGLLMLGMAVLALQVASVESNSPWQSVVPLLLVDSRFGAVWLAREALALAAVIALTLAVQRPIVGTPTGLELLCAAVALAIGPLSGHSAAEEPAWPTLTIHAVHSLAAGAWWGALPALATLVLAAATADASKAAQRTFRGFSSVALWLMLVIAGSGVALGVTHVERWPALLATPYGYLLAAKVLLLAGVLAMAARLRWRLLPALTATGGIEVQRRAGRWILAECPVAALIVMVATQLGQSIPARHDAIQWWLPFRFSIDATWDLAWTPVRAWSGTALLGLAVALAALALLGRLPRRSALLGALALCASAGALALPALSVQAYPDTYRKPSVPYQTISVAAGSDLFADHCTRCHGESDHGCQP